jgi:three-Cys-motif partner protein
VELAKYKGEGKPKIELFYFLAVRWLMRALKAVHDETILCKWWGRDDWKTLRELKPPQIKDRLVARFKSELGYKSVQAWPIFKQHATGQTVYYMIHATDHADGPRLMARAYNAAVLSRGEQTSFSWPPLNA